MQNLKTTKYYNLSRDLGPSNHYYQLAGEGLIRGQQFRDSELLHLSQKMAEQTISIPYLSEQFARTIALSRDIEKRLKTLSLINHQIEKLYCPYMRNYIGWVYSLNRHQNQYVIEMDNWRFYSTEQAAELNAKISKILDQAIDRNNLTSKVQETKFDCCDYTDCDFYDGQGILRKIITSHNHESGEYGEKTEYLFPDKLCSDQQVQTIWSQIKSILSIQTNDRPTNI